MYSIEEIFEYMWSIERFSTDSRPIEDIVLELKQIERDVKKEIQ